MKKYLLFIITIFMVLMPCVKADSDTTYIYNTNFYKDIIQSETYQNVLSDVYSQIEESSYKYYVITFHKNGDSYFFSLALFNTLDYEIREFLSDDYSYYNYTFYPSSYHRFTFYPNNYIDDGELGSSFNYALINSNSYNLYDTNIDFTINSSLEFEGLFNDSNVILEPGDIIPTLKELFPYNSFDDYESNNNSNYVTVNLNDYAYVYLIPKNYDIEPFQTSLFVQGSICLSALYGYGEKEKDNCVSDYCTKRYTDFTSIDFFVSESDLKNKAIFLIEIQDTSYGNYFKYDSSLFDIAYISEADKDNPKITISGKEYYPIAADNLTCSARKNTENGYIPGASCTLGDLNCQANTPHQASLSDILDNAMNFLSSIWNTFLSFMSLVTKTFNALPTEIRAISITTFTVGCILGLIKIIKS